MFNDLLRQIDKYSVISFDIFDTLLKRDVFKPKDALDIVERVYGKRSGIEVKLKAVRTQAEKEAREKSQYADITLDEIYDRIEISDKELLKQLELEVESSLLHANPAMKPVYDYCKEKGKIVYIISDMYLSSSFLEMVLHREGFTGYRKIFVSSEYRKTKRSGELFKKFCEEEKIDPKTVLHIGDSRYADYIGPRKVGIKGYHIDRLYKKTIYMDVPKKDADLSERTLFSFINSRIGACSTRAEQLGYEVLGPIIYSFCKWIHREYSKLKTDNTRLWFAARDMYLFAEAYKTIFNGENEFEYVYISRKSLRPVLTQLTGKMTEAGKTFARGQYTIKEILHKMGYSEKDVDEYKESELDEKYDIRRLDESKTAERILNSKRIVDKEKSLAATGEYYLRGHGLFDCSIVLADVGWHGTTQYILREIQKTEASDKKIIGLYLGSLDSTSEKLGDTYESFIFDENRDSLFTKGILVFESLILAQHGSTLRYDDSGKPVLGKPDNITDFLKAVQKGALEFVTDFNESILSKSVEIDSKTCSEAFCKLITEPRKEELKSIGNLDYDDAGYTKMARPKALHYYLMHPKNLLYELKYAPWRIGFLYNLFKVRLPYAKIYSFARKKQGKMT